MKKVFTTAVLFCSIQVAIAQEIKNDKSKGTWVIESNVNSPKDQLIKFYNSRQELIYQEEVKNKRIRIEKERVRRSLDKALNYALVNEQVLERDSLTASIRQVRRDNWKLIIFLPPYGIIGALNLVSHSILRLNWLIFVWIFDNWSKEILSPEKCKLIGHLYWCDLS